MPRPGQVLGLVGTNGIGKSTAIKVLAGKLKPNLGRFTVRPLVAIYHLPTQACVYESWRRNIDVPQFSVGHTDPFLCLAQPHPGALHGASHRQHCSPKWSYKM